MMKPTSFVKTENLASSCRFPYLTLSMAHSGLITLVEDDLERNACVFFAARPEVLKM